MGSNRVRMHCHIYRREVAEADEELAARRVGIVGACHRQHAKLVLTRVELRLNVVTRSAGAPLGLRFLVARREQAIRSVADLCI